MTQLSSKIRGKSIKAMEYSIISFRGTSQYTAGGPSACGLASVNAVRTILTRYIGEDSIKDALDKEETAISIMAICQFWTSTEHLDVQDILNLPLFQYQLETVYVEDKQSTLANFRTLARYLTEQGACGAVVTRSPEIVSLMSIPAEREKGGNLLVIFDSHNRPEHPLGAAFVLFHSPDDAATYLSKLFAVDASIMRDTDWQTQMLSHYSAHVMKARPFTEEDGLKAVYEANIRLLKTSAELKEAELLERESQFKIDEVRMKLEAQREARKQASLTEEEANQKLRTLQKELESARDLARSLPDLNVMRSNQWKGHSAPIDQHWFGAANYHKPGSHSKGKAVDRETHDVAPHKLGKSEPSKHQYQPRATSAVSEEEEYEGARQAHLNAKAAETRLKIQADKEHSLRQAQIEAERNDFETARRLQMEEEQSFMQHIELMRTVDIGFDCPICTDKFSVGMMSKIDSCEHVVCRDCMVGSVKAELDSRRWPILCPLCRATPLESGEPGVVTRNVFELAGAEEQDLTNWVQLELASVAVKIECPTCRKVSQVDQKDYNDTLMLWCLHTGCKAFWCKKCSQPGERGKRHTCDGEAEFERWKDGQKDVRDCPANNLIGCKTPIQRNEGCRHMLCTSPGCNTHFCDRCGQFITKSQRKSEIDTALGLHYTKCALFDDV